MMEKSWIPSGLLLVVAFARLSAGQQSGLSADQLIGLSAAQLHALSSDQSIGLSPGQDSGLSAGQGSELSAGQLSGPAAAPLTCYDGWITGGGEVELGNFTKTTCTEHQVWISTHS
jgi:hypothetical protein